jgi:hypothetical protein
MDVDLYKVALFILAVLPGYLARRGSDSVLPRTQRKTGATEEIAEFLIFHSGALASPQATTLVAAWFKPPTFSR